jgi:hypothetical protein
MPCYQSTNLPSGVTTTGRTSYATEADCLQACKEGACCEGTTCTVKPQCQCKCATNSCCGPDIVTVFGITGPACRGGTEAECAARGGVWRPCKGCAADANSPGTPYPCQPSDTPPASVTVFKGVGTTCSDNPCECANAGTSLELGRCCFFGFTQSGEGGKTKSQCDALGGTWVAARPSNNPLQNCDSGCTSNSVTGIGNYTCLECNPLP